MSTEQLPPQPTVTLGKDTKQHPQVWFTWADTQAYARAAIAAYRARGEGEPTKQTTGPWGLQQRASAASALLAGGDVVERFDSGRLDEGSTPSPVTTSPTAPDASQAEQAAMYVWLRENHSWWMLNRFPAQEEYTDPRVVFDGAIRTAMTKERQP